MSNLVHPTRPIFNAETAHAFLAMVTDPSYKKKSRPTQEKCNCMLEFSINSHLPYLPHEKLLAHRSRTLFHNHQDRLYANPTRKFRLPRAVILDEDVVDIVACIHRRELHAGADTIFLHAAHHFYTITRDEVRWLLRFCLPCQGERAATSAPAPPQPMESSLPFERVQIDLIDHRLTPDNNYTWILHAKDHFSKVTAIYPLVGREALTVAIQFRNWMLAYGPPRIV
jgi:hypothetical protein